MKTLLCLMLASFCFGSLFAQEAKRTPPKPLKTTMPVYPAALADTGREGKAMISIVVGADGSVSEPTVKSADDPAFGEAALDAIRTWTFEPAQKDGVPVPLRIDVPFNFVAPPLQRINALLKRKVYQTISEPIVAQKELSKRLKPVKKITPQYPAALRREGVTEKVSVTFVVAPDGTTLNPDIKGTPRKEFILPTVVAIAHATYEPPQKDGKAVYAQVETEVRFAPPQRPSGGGGGGGGGGDGGGGGGEN